MSKSVQITVQPNIIGGDYCHCIVEAGQSITELFPEISEQVEFQINGEVLPREDYDSYRLDDSDIIQIRIFPQGSRDGGKNVARTIALIAVVAASVGAGNFAGAQLGFSAALQAGVKAGIAIGGSALVNRFIPIPEPQNAEIDNSADFNKFGALTGTRNQLASYKVVPRVYGRHRFYPPLAAKPYTEVRANEQFLRQLLCVGYGPLKLSVPKIGDTIIGSFDADNNFTSNGNFEDIHIDVAEQPGLFTNVVDEESVNVDLNDSGDSGVRTTGEDVDEISMDFVFPQGLFGITETGKTTQAYVDVKIEIRETGTTEWDPFSDGTFPIYVLGDLFSKKSINHQALGVWRVHNSARETLRVGISVGVESGQYDIRVTRETAKGDGDTFGNASEIIDGAAWNVLRSIRHSNPTDLPGKVLIGMKVKATDQLNGILDNFSVIAESILPYYDGSQWQHPVFNPETGAATLGSFHGNPAWIIK